MKLKSTLLLCVLVHSCMLYSYIKLRGYSIQLEKGGIHQMEFAATCFRKLRDSNYSCEPKKNCGCCEIGVTDITGLKQKMDTVSRNEVINNTIPNHPWLLPEY